MAQFPADGHEIDRASAFSSVRKSVLSTSSRSCQVPCTSLATNACRSPELSSKKPPAPHSPADGQDSPSTCTLTASSAGGTGISLAARHLPLTSAAVNTLPPPLPSSELPT